MNVWMMLGIGAGDCGSGKEEGEEGVEDRL